MIQDGINSEEGDDSQAEDLALANRSDFKSSFVKEVVGVPRGLDIFKAVDRWAEAWGQLRGLESFEQSVEARRGEVPFFDRSPAAIKQDDSLREKQRTAGEEIATAERELSGLLPNANFGTDIVTFDNGQIQLSV